MSAASLKPVYLITGSDHPKIALALRRLRSRFEDGSVERLAAGEASGPDVVAAVNALGLFGGGERLVIVEEIERWKQADAAAVVEYLDGPTPGSVVALVGDPAKLTDLATACARAGDVLRYDVPTRKQRGRDVQDLPAWVRQQFERAGARVDQEAAERLAELAGPDTFALQNEVEKLVTWAAGGPIGVADVEALAVASEETSGSALTNAWSARDLARTLLACEADLRGAPEPFWLSARLAGHVTRVRAVQQLVDEGVGVQEIGKRLSLRFPPRREVAAAGVYSGDELDVAVVRLAALDVAIKGGSRIDPVLELERVLVAITAASDVRVGKRA